MTDPVYVRFNSNGGSSVDKQKVQKGAFAKEPTDPTKDGYTFYGWYANEDFSGAEFDFEKTAIDANVTLYAKWEKYVAPRTELPKAEEEDDYDPDKDEGITIADTFFSDAYKAKLLDSNDTESLFTTKFLEADFVDNIIVDEGKQLVDVLKDYIREGLAEMSTNLKNNLYKNTVEECYDYYLKAQHQSLLVARLKRMVNESTSVSEAEIKAEFNAQSRKEQRNFRRQRFFLRVRSHEHAKQDLLSSRRRSRLRFRHQHSLQTRRREHEKTQRDGNRQPRKRRSDLA